MIKVQARIVVSSSIASTIEEPTFVSSIFRWRAIGSVSELEARRLWGLKNIRTKMALVRIKRYALNSLIKLDRFSIETLEPTLRRSAYGMFSFATIGEISYFYPYEPNNIIQFRRH